MSLRRAADITRAYAGHLRQEFDRLSGVEVTSAERELADALDVTKNPRLGQSKSDSGATPPAIPADAETQARKILGVSRDATFKETTKVYEKLLKRADPSHFPEGSIESAQAATIRRRVEWAYQVLSHHADPTERRFGTLELD